MQNLLPIKGFEWAVVEKRKYTPENYTNNTPEKQRNGEIFLFQNVNSQIPVLSESS